VLSIYKKDKPPVELSFPNYKSDNSIHNIWKFPGSFHPPICNWIITNFTKETDIIMDPMCGSGVLPIQAYINKRKSYGFDIDPFSILMCRAKVKEYDMKELKNDIKIIETKLNKIERKKEELDKLIIKDEKEVIEPLPKIFNYSYWFKNYILNDLGRTISIINDIDENKIFFQSCLGSIIRFVSNADPVPISGLEITSHIKKRNKRRKINFIKEYQKRIEHSFKLIENFNFHYNSIERPNFNNLEIKKIQESSIEPNAIIFSPPYCNAIEYYRRHRLEYMILGLLEKNDIVEKSKAFIGSTSVSIREEPIVIKKIKKLKKVHQYTKKIHDRIIRFHVNKYFVDTRDYLSNLYTLLPENGKLTIVIGDSVAGGVRIPTGELIHSIANKAGFSCEKTYIYPIKNKRMNYTRRNNANIKTEKILFFCKR
jgi:hypothetical protein